MFLTGFVRFTHINENVTQTLYYHAEVIISYIDMAAGSDNAILVNKLRAVVGLIYNSRVGCL